MDYGSILKDAENKNKVREDLQKIIDQYKAGKFELTEENITKFKDALRAYQDAYKGE